MSFLQLIDAAITSPNLSLCDPAKRLFKSLKRIGASQFWKPSLFSYSTVEEDADEMSSE